MKTTGGEEKNNQMALHPNEMWLIQKWREEYRFGELTIIIQDGLPVRIRKVEFGEAPKIKEEKI